MSDKDNEKKPGEEQPNSGVYFGIEWEIDSASGILTIRPAKNPEEDCIPGECCIATAPWSGREDIKRVVFEPRVFASGSLAGMFSGCSELEDIDFADFDTAGATSFFCMFASCRSLKHIDLSRFDTSNVTNMSSMFDSCDSLESVDLSSFDTRRVEDMSAMFWCCSSLRQVDLGHFELDKMECNDALLHGCSNLSELILGADWVPRNFGLIGMHIDGNNLKSLRTLEYRGGEKQLRKLIEHDFGNWPLAAFDAGVPLSDIFGRFDWWNALPEDYK